MYGKLRSKKKQLECWAIFYTAHQYDRQTERHKKTYRGTYCMKRSKNEAFNHSYYRTAWVRSTGERRRQKRPILHFENRIRNALQAILSRKLKVASSLATQLGQHHRWPVDILIHWLDFLTWAAEADHHQAHAGFFQLTVTITSERYFLEPGKCFEKAPRVGSTE